MALRRTAESLFGGAVRRGSSACGGAPGVGGARRGAAVCTAGAVDFADAGEEV